MITRNLLIALLLPAISFYSPSAFADKDGKGHGKGNHKSEKYSNNAGDKSGDGRKIVIDNSDSLVIRQYIGEDYRSSCPPGLAKKHNGCLPPGQAKKRYVIGQPLEYGIWQPVPQSLIVRLNPLPRGYQYVMVDKDVLLISEASHHVIDAITLLSAVGN